MALSVARVRVKALRSASLWSLAVAPLLAIGTLVALQFPLATDPFSDPERPTIPAVLASAGLWLTVAGCECALAYRHPFTYRLTPPFPAFVLAWQGKPRRFRLPVSRYARQALSTAFLLGAIPLLFVAMGTALIPIFWIATVAACIPLAIGATVHRFKKWRDFDVQR